ncbi:MAG: enoyl-CoA hydratase/isomerase family protein [Acidiferrobacterales bacterium]|nr:enoyl-CoA hydratase/isomerase family protein [Acidiferrobacterales bacterium]
MSGLIVEHDADLKILQLNRPDRANALNADLVQALIDEIDRSAYDGTRTLVIRGSGRSFCSGFDLGNLEEAIDSEVADRIVDVEKMLQALYHAPVLTVALVQSMAFGAGADLVCSCHVRIAEPGSRFCMPGLNFGILLGTRRLKSRIGTDNTVSVLVNTRVFDADQAIQMGFLTHVASRDTWEQHIESARLAGNAVAASHVRRMLNVVADDTRHEDMADLIDSVSEPGLVQRIVDYRNTMRKQSGKA